MPTGSCKRNRRSQSQSPARVQNEKGKSQKGARTEQEESQLKLKSNMQACQPDFRHVVQQWAKDKTTAKVNRFFELLPKK